uniref:DUF1758 domain-containing protein n=1 Tax=Panagrellus redivivus TaxID=6233 RepID=A0A7E4W713_PANRE
MEGISCGALIAAALDGRSQFQRSGVTPAAGRQPGLLKTAFINPWRRAPPLRQPPSIRGIELNRSVNQHQSVASSSTAPSRTRNQGIYKQSRWSAMEKSLEKERKDNIDESVKAELLDVQLYEIKGARFQLSKAADKLQHHITAWKNVIASLPAEEQTEEQALFDERCLKDNPNLLDLVVLTREVVQKIGKLENDLLEEARALPSSRPATPVTPTTPERLRSDEELRQAQLQLVKATVSATRSAYQPDDSNPSRPTTPQGAQALTEKMIKPISKIGDVVRQTFNVKSFSPPPGIEKVTNYQLRCDAKGHPQPQEGAGRQVLETSAPQPQIRLPKREFDGKRTEWPNSSPYKLERIVYANSRSVLSVSELESQTVTSGAPAEKRKPIVTNAVLYDSDSEEEFNLDMVQLESANVEPDCVTKVQEEPVQLNSVKKAPDVALLTADAVVASTTNRNVCSTETIFFDLGSQASFVQEDLANDLQLQQLGAKKITVRPFASQAKEYHSRNVEFDLALADGTWLTTTAFTVPDLPKSLTSVKLETDEKGKKDVKMRKHVSARILKGADNMAKLGDLVGGSKEHDGEYKVNAVTFGSVDETTKGNVEKIYAHQNLGIPSSDDPYADQADDDAIKEFQKGLTYDEVTKRYTARLLYKPDPAKLAKTEKMARAQLVNLWNKLKEKPDFLKKYHDTIMTQLKSGIIEMVYDNGEESETYYTPHHAIINLNKLFPSLRVVINAPARTKFAASLNDLFLRGPVLLPWISSKRFIRSDSIRTIVMSLGFLAARSNTAAR